MSKKTNLQNKEAAFENNYFEAFFQRIPFARLDRLLKDSRISLTDKTVLVCGCGQGRDVYYLEKFYRPKKIYMSDIKPSCLVQASALFPYAKAIASDNQALALKDNSIDYVVIGTSLHHLPEPLKGIYELLRVAKHALIVNEPNDTWLTRLFEGFGLAREYEVEHNNYVYRFRKREVEKISKAMFYRHATSCFFATHRIAKSRLEFIFLCFLNRIANLVYPSLGNYILFVIIKEKVMPKCFRKKNEVTAAA
ncbi:MAG: class I SAM-dependent methyltransferase [Candidatus Omnitrophota bacterium]